MKIAFVTDYDSEDVTNYSGIGYYMGRALENEAVQVKRIGPLADLSPYFYKLKQLTYREVFGKRYLRDREPAVLKSYAKQLEEILSESDADLVLSPGTVAISYLECRQPIVFWSDATFAGMLDFYHSFSNLDAQSVVNGNKMEQSALSRAGLAIYCSDWAAKTAVANYEVDAEKVKVVPYGANIDVSHTREDMIELVKARASKCRKLLFLGVEWHRKGGDIALSVAQELNRQGLNTKLYVIGCEPPIKKPYPSFLEVVPFVNKGTREGMDRLISYLLQSHFLILPTRAEAFACVTCEASAFGLPAIIFNPGGLPIEDHVNGHVMAPDASVADFCELIVHYFDNFEEYRALAVSSYDRYANHLNWEMSADRVRSMIAELC
jgi:glycosyltransferase involved in cell wall biosynthesis